jgi:hypothetical protein
MGYGTSASRLPLHCMITYRGTGNSVDPIGLWVSENTDPTYVYTSQDVFYLKLAFAASVLYFTIAGATKLGILLMYNRIFNVSTSFRFQLYGASALLVAWWVGCTIATLTNCIPLEWSWINSFADPRYCFDYNIFWMASGASEICLDVLILMLPVSVVVRMRLSLKQKLTVLGIFLLGGLYVLPKSPSGDRRNADSISSIIITGLIKVILGYPKGRRVPSYSNTEVWTTVHAGMSIVCACLPIFKPLAKRIAGSPLIGRLSRFRWWQPNAESARSSKKSSKNSSVGDRELEHVNTSARPGETAGTTVPQLPNIQRGPDREPSLPARLSRFLETDENRNSRSYASIEAV